MGGSKIFDWGGPRIEKARNDGQNMALLALKSWSIVPPPLEPPLAGILLSNKNSAVLEIRIFLVYHKYIRITSNLNFGASISLPGA